MALWCCNGTFGVISVVVVIILVIRIFCMVGGGYNKGDVNTNVVGGVVIVMAKKVVVA